MFRVKYKSNSGEVYGDIISRMCAGEIKNKCGVRVMALIMVPEFRKVDAERIVCLTDNAESLVDVAVSHGFVDLTAYQCYIESSKFIELI